MKDRLYTTRLSAGLGVINETRLLLEIWAEGMKGPNLFKNALESGQFPSISARRLKNIINECFIRRFLVKDDYPISILKKLNAKLTSKEFSQLLYLFTARANPILADFITEVYWRKYVGGHEQIHNDESKGFVQQANNEGKTVQYWSESMIKRVSSYLTGCCADFGLLEKGRKRARKILPFRIEQKAAAFLAYDLHFSGLGDNAVITHSDWKLFGLQAEDVRDELKRLSLKGFFIIQAAGNVTRIAWNFNNWEEFINVISKS